MKILCFIDSLGSGGAQRQLVNTALEFKKCGNDVSFLTYFRSEFFKPVLDEAGIPVELIEKDGMMGRMLAVRRYIRKGGFDVVLSFLDTPSFLACFSALGGKKWKLIMSERSATEENFRSKKQKIYKLFARESDYITCNSEVAAEMWKKHCPQYSDKIRVIYNIVNIPEADYEQPENDGITRLTIAASYSEIKNTKTLPQAVSLLSEEERKRLHINWFGAHSSEVNKRYYDESEQLVREHGVQDVISLNSETDRIYNEMSKADVVALVSHYEGLPNVICEGMSLKKPVLMTRVSDYEVLVTEKNGFLCDADNPQSIADALRAVLSKSRGELEEMGVESYKIAQPLFDRNSVIKKWLELMK